MRVHTLFTCIALTGMSMTVGCTSEDQLRKVEQEVGDLKLEVFKMRQQMEDANARAEAERLAAGNARSLDRRFQADLQEMLRQLMESTRILNNRLGSTVVRPAAGPTPIPAAKPEGVTEVATVSTPEDEKAFNTAVLDYNRGNYALAAESLGLFLKSNPQSPRRPDALFFLGLSYYNQKVYDKAQQAFDQILKNHGSSGQFLPAKLKRAQCLAKQSLKAAAVKAFKEIVEGFPGTPEARTAQQEMSDLGY